MVATKPLEQVAAKWVSRSAAAGPDYEAGVRQPKKDYARNAAAAKGSWYTGVSQANADNRFEKGINRVGTQGWQAKTISKGTGRFTGGVQQAQADYNAGVGPVLAAIGRVQLPDRGPKGDARNYQRVQAVGTALRALKASGGAKV